MMKKLWNARVVFAAVFVVVFAILIWTASGYNQLAKTMPLLVSIPVFIGAILNLINEVRVSLNPQKEKKTEGASSAAALEAQAKVLTPLEQDKVMVANSTLQMATAGGAVLPPPGIPVSGGVPVPTVKPGEIAKPEKKSKKVTGKERTRRELIGAAWIIGYVAAIMLFGFPLATLAYLVGFLHFWGKESWKLTIIYTVVLFAFIWIAFVVFLKSNLYWGLVFDWIGWQGW